MASTSVKVAVRVRPLSPKEVLSSAQECISYIDGTPQLCIGPSVGNNDLFSSTLSLAHPAQKSFTFDHVFNTNSTQAAVYEECVQPLVDRFLEGFNATVLAYGQTGSGKTYSMGTGLDTAEPEDHGLVPRAIYYLFDHLRDQALSNPEGFKYEVYVSFLELYNEEIVDLLNPKPKDTTGWGGLSIREDAGKIVWHGVKDIPVSSPEELLTLLEKGSLCRTTGSTDMNAASSRSHAIFSVTLKQQKWTAAPQNDTSKPNTPTPNETPVPSVRDDDSRPETPSTHPDGSYQNLVSKFHFVDLAGSERLKRTNAEGDRKKEGISINQGLLALGNVISALGDDTRKGAHVPYRDSKLTRMLQDSLGGNSQTLMLACVSPSDTNYGETMNTLNYANRARNIKNKVVINQEWAG
ncbi:P-loop containing nucleoside triphosphate hydrolase protein, partial [Gaertneriomyces semiglobifer]